MFMALLGSFTGCRRPETGTPNAIQTEPPGAEAERAKFQGAWKHLSIDLDGKQAQPRVAAGFVYRFEGSRFTNTDNGAGKVTSQGTFTLDPTATPPAIDFAESEGVRIYGIYRFEGDRLTICLHEQRRPTEFESRAGQRRSLVVLERQK